jgi:hypothetical protein
VGATIVGAGAGADGGVDFTGAGVEPEPAPDFRPEVFFFAGPVEPVLPDLAVDPD